MPARPTLETTSKVTIQIMYRPQTHSIPIGYLLWIFGFLGAHRFYFGKPISGTLYFFTLGLFFIGWIVDLFLIPGMNRDADIRFNEGEIDYNITWLLLTFLGLFGIHRMYMGKWLTGLLYLCTGGLFLLGYIYDFWTLNDQISLINGAERRT
jgi:TM2 domain-containing membrane protein YozV